MAIIAFQAPRYTPEDGAYRKSPLSYSWTSRGGKTTCLQQLFENLKTDYLPLLINLTGQDDFKLRSGETPSMAILRLIGSQLVKDDSGKFSEKAINAKIVQDVEKANKPFVLLIDGLNHLEPSDSLSDETKAFLKRMFLDPANRYLVYSSNTPLTVDKLAEYSPRGVKYITMPHSRDLQSLKAIPGCEDLTPLEAVMYATSPGMIFSFKSQKNILSPEGRIQAFCKQFQPSDFTDEVLKSFVKEVLTGWPSGNKIVNKFESFTFVTSSILYPLCYFGNIMKLFDSNQFAQQLGNMIVKHLPTCASLPTSGKDWEIIVLVAIMLRSLQSKFNKGTPPLFQIYIPITECYFVNIPCEYATLEAAHTFINESTQNSVVGSYQLFVPSFSTFPVLDAFITFKPKEDQLIVVGVQNKLRRENDTADLPDWIDRGHVFRGDAAKFPKVDGKWRYWGADEISDFFGYSLSFVEPNTWSEQ